MKKELVEIYSDASNHAVMKHPGRQYPGSLIQGDTLNSLCRSADKALKLLETHNYSEACEEVNDLRDELNNRLTHYISILKEHNIDLPFNEA